MSSERRLHPRVHTDLPAELELFAATYDVRVVNLSLGGFLVEGGGELAQLSAPMGSAALELDLHFGLRDRPLHCRCRVVYKRRQAYDRVALGLHVLSISQAGEEALQTFVDEQLIAC